MARETALRGLVAYATGALVDGVTQTAACNQVHQLAARAARWLLVTGERVGSDTFPMTQQLMARMLNVRRPAVSEALAPLQQSGVVSFQHGALTIHDRSGLTAVACACYRSLLYRPLPSSQKRSLKCHFRMSRGPARR